MIPLYSESQEYLGTIEEDAARVLIQSGRARVVRDRSGQTRRLYEIADEKIPLRGASKVRAISGYIGAVKYTYLEMVEPHVIHMLKRYVPSTGAFVHWPKSV